jgi:Ni/Co efflux regulator RcnB
MRNTLTVAALSFAVFAGTISLAAAQDGRYDRDDDHRYHRDYDRDDYYRHDFREGLQSARQIGYQDGMQVAREDSWRGKPYNPYPRGHNHADRGYEREFGSLQEYREHYARAYSEGYSQGYQGYGNGYNR